MVMALSVVLVLMAFGAVLPFWLPQERRDIPLALAAAAGIMLATALGHLLPDAVTTLGEGHGAGREIMLERELATEERVGEGRRGADRHVEGAGALAETRLQAGAVHLDELHAQPGDETRVRREIMAELDGARNIRVGYIPQNASEVLREGLRLIERRESEDEMRLTALREAAKVGIADIETGNFHSFDSADMLGHHLTALTSDVIGA